MGPSGRAEPHLFAAVICVEKKRLYPAVKEIRKASLGVGSWLAGVDVCVLDGPVEKRRLCPAVNGIRKAG